MSSKQQSPLPPQLPASRSLIASKVSVDENEQNILKDLRHNYMSVEKISRIHDKDGQPIGVIRIDFTSDNVTKTILDTGYVLIDGKRRPVRPFWPLICRRCHNEGHHVAECPQKPLTEQRLMELFKDQQR